MARAAEPIGREAFIMGGPRAQGVIAEQHRRDCLALCARVTELEAALALVLPMAESWADGKGRYHPDADAVAAARRALEGGGT